MLGFAPSRESKKTGEGEKTILDWCIKATKPDPFNPRMRQVFHEINAIAARKDISREEKKKLYMQVDACAPPTPGFDKIVRADVDMDEDEEDEVMDEINAIRNRRARGEITDEEMMLLLMEETDDEEDMEEDKGIDEVEGDGETGKAPQLVHQEKPGSVKRPQSSLFKSELECRKPRVAPGFSFPRGEHVAAEM